MLPTNRDSRLRAIYAQLKALAEIMPEIAYEYDATSYNRLVDELITLGYDAEEFKLHPEDLFYPVASVSSRGEKRYRDFQQVRYQVLDRKVAALLTFFTLTNEATVVEVALDRLKP